MQIKPCPWCGGTDVVVGEGSTFRWRFACCNGCGAQAPEIRHDTLEPDVLKADEDSHTRALNAWNNRKENDNE